MLGHQVMKRSAYTRVISRGLRIVGSSLNRSKNHIAVIVSNNEKFINKNSVLSNYNHQLRRALSSAAPSAAQVTNFKTIPELAEEACALFAERNSFGTRKGNEYTWITYKEFGHLVQKFRNVLAHHHIGRGDKVAIISNNRVEWAIAMYAVTGVGAQLVPMYEAQLKKDWEFIIKDSDSKLVIVANEKIYDQTKGFIGTLGKVQSILTLDTSDEYMHSYTKWMKLVENEAPVPALKISPDELAVIIYTSGTTGVPKGVELSHFNVVSNLKDLQSNWKENLFEKKSLAYLPWAHVFGQTCELHCLIGTGSALGIVEKRELILDSLTMIKPSILCSVPVLFNRVYDGVLKKMSTESPLKQKLFHAALKISRQRNQLLEEGKSVSAWLNFKHKIVDKVVFSKIRDRLGGNIQLIISGGAATSLPVLHFFEDIGIPICEGYGLTETSPVITSNLAGWGNRRLGTAGIALPNVDLRIVDPETKADMPPGQDGEICAAGPNIMTGYRNNAKANDEVFFFKDGKKFFRTGDLGRMIDGKYLKITGRIKEQYKLENGKYVVPAPLEDALARSQFISQAFLFGDNKPYNVTLIVPDYLELKPWAEKKGIKFTDDASLVQSVEVINLIKNELMSCTTLMKSYERPSKFILLSEPFSQENQMLTPKMSLRRNNVMGAYKGLIDSMYANTSGTECKVQGGASD